MNRRRFLTGAAGVVALPFLHSALSRSAWGTAPTQPQRMLYYFVPNGMPLDPWTPKAVGRNYPLSPILAPLADLAGEVSVLSGLNMPAAIDPLPGDHARGTASFLTCTKIRKTAGADIANGISIDQVVAQQLGHLTPFPSLQVGMIPGGNTGDCTAGYSCAYSRNISWAGPATPLPNITDAQILFDRLVGGGSSLSPEAAARRAILRASVLDEVRTEAEDLSRVLGRSDRAKLDEYLTAVRELEVRIQSAGGTCDALGRPGPNLDFADKARILSDLMVLAFRCDLTRVLTFMMGSGASNQSFDFIGIPGAHHQISHHQDDPKNLADLEAIGTWEVAQLAYLLAGLQAVDEEDGTLLDNTLVYFGSEIQDGNAHSHTDLPVLLAGRGGGYLPGEHRVYDEAPMANLFLAMAARFGVALEGFGDDGTEALSLD